MKKVGIIANTTKIETKPFAEKLADWLLKNGCVPLVNIGTEPNGAGNVYTDSETMFKSKCDFIMVLGGDGTLLNASSLASKHDVPLLGINMGRLGYLTDVDADEAFNALSKVLRGEYKEEKRMMLSVSSNSTPNTSWAALNDVVISRNSASKMLKAEILINGEYIDTYRADGIIISTPTGSTAYNLSAGGPILEPTVEMIIISLICPHLIYSRPYVISAEDVIDVTIKGENNNNDTIISVDGQNVATLNDNETVTISKSKYYTRTIRTTSLGFYDILRQKMMTLHDY